MLLLGLAVGAVGAYYRYKANCLSTEKTEQVARRSNLARQECLEGELKRIYEEIELLGCKLNTSEGQGFGRAFNLHTATLDDMTFQEAVDAQRQQYDELCMTAQKIEEALAEHRGVRSPVGVHSF